MSWALALSTAATELLMLRIMAEALSTTGAKLLLVGIQVYCLLNSVSLVTPKLDRLV